MQLLDDLNREIWDRFAGGQDYSQFLQSWEWGEFQEKIGNSIRRLAVLDQGEIVAVATLIKKKLGGGLSYWFCPRGPVIELRIKNYELRINVLDFLFNEIEKLAKRENVLFIRVEPKYKIQDTRYKIQKTINIEPRKTIILDLSMTEGELLAAMHPKTRYNIRLAAKKGVKIFAGTEKNFSGFWRIMAETGKRDKFRLHNRDHYEKMVNFNSAFIKLWLAEYDGKIIAGNIMAFFGDTATYVHGASANECREAMASYALQWQSIKTAKEQGFKYYDFFGIDESKWPGVTRFKRGFGGTEIEYPGTYDVLFNQLWYKVYKIARKMRRKL